TLPGELGTMRACVAEVFDDLHLGVGIADTVTELGRHHFGIPVHSGGAAKQRGRSNQRGRLDQPRQLHPSFSFAPRLRASDSRTVRSSGSPISRRLSPSSMGMGL